MFRISVTGLDSKIGELKKLEILQITNHYCKTVPWNELGKLKNLKLFDMGEGYLFSQNVTKDICNWNQLRYFRMTGTQITYLPNCISEWKQIKRVELNVVSLTSIPSQFFLLPNLVAFVCEWNQITYDGLMYVLLFINFLYLLYYNPCFMCNCVQS